MVGLLSQEKVRYVSVGYVLEETIYQSVEEAADTAQQSADRHPDTADPTSAADSKGSAHAGEQEESKAPDGSKTENEAEVKTERPDANAESKTGTEEVTEESKSGKEGTGAKKAETDQATMTIRISGVIDFKSVQEEDGEYSDWRISGLRPA